MHHYQHCYVAVGDTYPVEVFLTKSAAMVFVEDWNSRNPNRPIRCYRCPLNKQTIENEKPETSNTVVYS
jgi:hypothetical protein